jgi:hypothetical protein
MSKARNISNLFSASTDVSTDAEVTAALSTHSSAADPHSVYLKESEYVAAGKNKVLNGDFGIWQRGTSFTNPADNTYVCDRFRQNGNGSGFTKIWSRQAFTPGAAPMAGYESPFFFRFNQTVAGTGGTNNNIAIYSHEDVRTFAGQTVTLSFWAKADASRVLNLYYGQEFNNSGTGDQYPYISSSTLTTSWTRYTFTFTVASISGKTIGTGFTGNFQLVFNAANNITQTIDLWGVQLEAGSVATPFTTNTANPQAELAACQRYFVRYIPNSINANTMYFASGNAISTTRAMVSLPLPVSLRAVPTLSKTSGVALYNQGSNYYFNSSGTLSSAYQMSQNILNLDCWVPSGLTNNTPVMISLISSNDYLDFSAEL